MANKHNTIIEIDGIRHKMVKTKKGLDSCSICSLEKMCTVDIGSPCLSTTHFIKERQKDL